MVPSVSRVISHACTCFAVTQAFSALYSKPRRGTAGISSQQPSAREALSLRQRKAQRKLEKKRRLLLDAKELCREADNLIEKDHFVPYSDLQISPEIKRNPIALISKVYLRSEGYQQKYAHQEVSLLFHLWRLLSSIKDDRKKVVLDIGAGNGHLASLIALCFSDQLEEVRCVESRDVQCEKVETKLPKKFKITRVVANINDYMLPMRSDTVYIVLAKHLCGASIDMAIDFAKRNQDVVKGCIFATCCFPKITLRAELFCKFCNLQPEAKACIEQLARTSGWRTTFTKDRKPLEAEMLHHAAHCESILQSLRKKKLAELFPSVTELLYCQQSFHSAQNRCLLAGPCLAEVSFEDEDIFFSLLEDVIAKHQFFLPIDLRP